MNKPELVFLFIVIFICIFGVLKTANATIVQDTFETSGTGTAYDYFGGNGGSGVTSSLQTITANMTVNLYKIRFLVSDKFGSPSNLTFHIKYNSQSQDLYNVSLAASQINYTSGCVANWINLNNFTIENGKSYAFTTDDGSTSPHYYSDCINSSNPYPGGYEAYGRNGAFTNESGKDIPYTFYFWYESAAGVQPLLNLNWNLSNGTWTNYNYTIMGFNGSITNNSEFYNCSYKYGNTQIQSWDSINLSKNWNNTFDNFPTLQWVNISLNCSNLNATDYKSALYYFNWSVTPPIDQSQNTTYLLNQVNTKLDDLRGELEMAFMNLSLVILWLGLWIFGYYAITTKNELLGVSMIVMTLPINVYFAYIFREVMNLGTGFIGVGFIAMSFWMFGIILYTRRTVSKV